MLSLVAIIMFLCSCVRDVNTDEMSMTGETEEDIPSSPEEYLGWVTYLKYELTGSEEPYFVGRWFDKDINGEPHKVTVTSGSTAYFMVYGTASFDVDFTLITDAEPYYSVSVDGKTPVRHSISDRTIELSDDGYHTVRLIADGIYENIGKWDAENGYAFRGISNIQDGGKILGIKPKNKVIFFYGDSITEGIAALTNTGMRNSATSAYPWFCSEQLHAVPYYIGYGASGIVKNGSFAAMYDSITHLSADREVDFSVVPDVIVINHGTNDGDVPDGEFKNRLVETLDLLVSKYPGVPVVYMIPICQAKTNVITEVASERDCVTAVRTAAWFIAKTDTVHPSVGGAKTAGKKLAESLTEILGKEFFNDIG